jgi:predicted aminopeptidase
VVGEARAFAVTDLSLPDNDSYRTYVQLDRPYVVWNVFAAPEFSVEPRRWCFPVAGCVVYRGYFHEEAANRYAARLAGEGWDVFVGGATAYSTLGRFDDPVLSTMLRQDDTGVVAIIFHELAHQRLYVKDDSEFNEAFASAVEGIGVHRWLDVRGSPEELASYQQARQRRAAFNLLLFETRTELAQIYARGGSDVAMSLAKQEAFAGLRRRYVAVRDSWGGYTGYDAWFEGALNNARLVPVSTYSRLVPAFMELYRRADRQMDRFYELCEGVADLPSGERAMELETLLAVATGGPEEQAPAPPQVSDPGVR